jgi:hypothetical protein
VQKVKSTRGSHHRFTGAARHSPRNGFNGFLRDLPGDRALLSPSSCEYGWSAPGRADFASAKLDASVEASGPHDFAVRSNIVRLRALSPLTGWTPPCDDDCAPTLPRPPHPVPNVRDDRETPLCVGRDGGSSRVDLGFSRSRIFFRKGLDHPNHLDPAREFRAYAQRSARCKTGCPNVGREPTHAS